MGVRETWELVFLFPSLETTDRNSLQSEVTGSCRAGEESPYSPEQVWLAAVERPSGYSQGNQQLSALDSLTLRADAIIHHSVSLRTSSYTNLWTSLDHNASVRVDVCVCVCVYSAEIERSTV